jgi:TolB-like protein
LMAVWLSVALVVIVTIVMVSKILMQHSPDGGANGAAHSIDARNTVAVLPLQNFSNNSSMDYLRFALSDEISNALTYTRSLEIRPSSMTQKYDAPNC